MKTYPSITKDLRKDVYIYAFDKKDGSQIRAGWSSKRGFYKFGTKTQLIDEKSIPFGMAIPIIKEKYENDLSLIFKEHRWRDALCFFEFYGSGSFAGNHNYSEKMDVLLFDVNPYKEGLIPPAEFLKCFKHLDIPKVLYEGHINSELIDSIKQSTLDGMTFEGIVAKGANDKKTKTPIMFKIKSQAWLDKLKNHCGNNISLYEKLE